MRLALLSALAETPGASGASAGERPAFRRFAGKTVLAHQIDCAAHLGCERILCHVSTPGPDLATAKLHAERAGIRFETVESAVRFRAQVAAHDDVILIEDGVLPDRAALVENLAGNPAVIAFPADPAVGMGFERLDATRAWGGALRTRGENVARLADLPADCDLGSALLRIALQTGARIAELDAAPLVEGSWQRRVDRQTAHAKEWRWVTRQVKPAPFASPGRAVLERVGLRWAQDASGGRWARVPHALALGLGVLAALSVGFARPMLGLIFLLLASCAWSVAAVFDRVDALGSPPRKPGMLLPAGRWALDALLVAVMAIQMMTVPAWLGTTLPLVLVGLLWLGEGSAGPRTRALMSDRIALILVLIPVAYLGLSTVAVMAIALITLACLLWTARQPNKQITAD